ncbi:glucose-1-phosphate adenylyltransferase [Sediminispirochaeta bajacaliforniensis]|uniref:glucose-1-phosphate adenylyltransferase n=1 Tax=Sediminispirochaeta bajacaliforniensis TaxID=148 RepID=UPI00036E475E|nr:glucose-1-phosphate adenylyltransferase [Sediminispirochaeta bajacaliforniensis]
MNKPLAIVLGGGKGTRLFPLTKERAKPAVPFGGKYRLVDIPISNCINSGIRQVYILTQFNTASLHNHISSTFIFDVFSNGFVEILAAEQTFDNNSWYQGTADAVRKNFYHFHDQSPSHYIILSGDQLYRMDLAEMLNKHIESGAEVTIAATPVSRQNATGLGIISADKKGRAVSFIEKPDPEDDISHMSFDRSLLPENQPKVDLSKEYLASMGMYIFNAKTLEKVLDNNYTDFGKEIIPIAIGERYVNTYIFTGFWEDIGTIKAFYETNLNLASLTPAFNFYDEKRPIYTHRRHLAATKMNFCTISQSLAAEGSIITNASIVNSVIGIRTLIESGANLDGVYCMGANFYETWEQKKENEEQGIPNIGIGRGTIVRKAIIDLNARIGDGCRLGIDPIGRKDGDYGYYWIVDGIIVIPKNGIVPAGTII